MRKITLKEMYEELKMKPSPGQQFIRELAALTNRSELTVRLWLGGHHEPEPLVAQVIAKAYDLDPDYLFSKSGKDDHK